MIAGGSPGELNGRGVYRVGAAEFLQSVNTAQHPHRFEAALNPGCSGLTASAARCAN